MKICTILAVCMLSVSLLPIEVARAGDAPRVGWLSRKITAPGLEYHIFSSASAGEEVSYHIFFPPGYKSDQKKRFPVIFWLHGRGSFSGAMGVYGAGGGKGPAAMAEYYGEAMKSGKMPEALVVFPNGLGGGMWSDSLDGKTPVETIFIKELIPEIDKRFRTIGRREGRIIEGFSMGGYGAARLGFKYPGLFRAVSILGAGPLQREFTGAIGPSQSAEDRELVLQKIYGGSQDYFFRQSPWHIAEENKAKLQSAILIRQAIGALDTTLPANREFHEHLASLGITHTFEVVAGVKHDALALLKAMGDGNWKFYTQEH
ncbi:MAG: alpha/beta hydrolase-fold protein [Candidatus Eremiobacteraeota bacterium]|nr:alpha/beta hydrolase-fold protein [Candidatus Eremiobacteraeota bacterium]